MGKRSMSLLSDFAVEHQARRIWLAKRAAGRARALWRQMDVNALDASWDLLAPRLTSGVVASQVGAARQSAPYLAGIAALSGERGERAALNPAEFGGWMGDGREVGPALYGAVTTTKKAIGAGMSPPTAFESGASFLALLVQSAITDMGRSADATLATGKGYERYVRVVNPGACSRCAILAGSERFSKPFKRHPACKCTTLPVKDDVPVGAFASPSKYFESLSRSEQDRVFTKAGAESIRLGASPASVVNSRRGMVAGQKVTKDGTSVRGAFGRLEQARNPAGLRRGAGDRYRRTNAPRLMPESILQMAGTDQELAKTLLREYGYLR